MGVVNLEQKFALFDEQWTPKIVGELNGQYVKLAKIQGELVWHAHNDEDEMFFVVQGSLTIRMRDHEVTVNQGEFYIVPRGVEHFPFATEEARVMLFEPKETAHTGDVIDERTVTEQQWI